MARRRRRRPSGSAESPQRTASAPPKEGAKPKPGGRGGSRRRTRKPLEVRARELIEQYPPEVSKVADTLRACREVQEALSRGTVTDPTAEELFYFFASGVETLAEEDLDRLYDTQYRPRFMAIRTECGVPEEEIVRPEDSRLPEEYRDLYAEFRAAKRVLLAGLLRQYEQEEMAAMVEQDYSAYLEAKQRGKQKLFSRDLLETMQIPLSDEELAARNALEIDRQNPPEGSDTEDSQEDSHPEGESPPWGG